MAVENNISVTESQCEDREGLLQTTVCRLLLKTITICRPVQPLELSKAHIIYKYEEQIAFILNRVYFPPNGDNGSIGMCGVQVPFGQPESRLLMTVSTCCPLAVTG